VFVYLLILVVATMSYRRRIKRAEVLKRILDNSSDSEFDLSDSVDDSDDESRSQTPPPVPRTGAAGVTKAATSATDAFDWQPYDDLDCFYPEWLPEYKRRRSVLVDTSDYSPVHYFQLYFPDSVFDLMETEVNRFATQRLTPQLICHLHHIFINGRTQMLLK